MFAEILGLDAIAVVGIIAIVFGASRLPKIARSVGLAKGEFEKGLKDGAISSEVDTSKKDELPKI